MRKLFLVLLAVFLCGTSTAGATTLKPWQVPINDSGLQDQNIFCLMDIDKHGNITVDCRDEPQYIPGWAPHGKRVRIF